MALLNERRWVLGGGLTREWDWVMRRRVEETLGALRRVARGCREKAPSGLLEAGLKGLRYFLETPGLERDRLAVHPCLDYWLHLWGKHFSLPARARDWRLHLGLFQGFAASLALARKARLDLEAVADPEGRFFLFGTPWYLQLASERGQEPLALRLRPGSIEIVLPRRRRPVRLALPLREVRSSGFLSLKRLPEVVPGIVADDRGWLMRHGVVMHGLARLEGGAMARFVEVIRRAFSDMASREPGLCAEMTDMLRAVIPIENPLGHGSVSSSYVNLRGAVCLSHAEDPLLQAETLIHEFCHQKMNQLLAVDPLLLPGQSGQVFYSPWRDDPRRLRGLLLGAHAFLNVARYLSRSLQRDSFSEDQAVEVMVNVSRRLNQSETALKSLSIYGSFTEFGRRFLLGLWRELGLLRHAESWFPPLLLKEQQEACEEHRRGFALFGTGIHRSQAFVDKVRRAAFLTPGETAAPAAAEKA